MKKFIQFLLFASIGMIAFTSCSKGDDPQPDEPQEAPSVTWIGGDIEAVHEITDKMSVKIKVTAPVGIKTFTIDIDSPALTEKELNSLKLATNMDLITPATPDMGEALKNLGFPAGTSILNSTEQTFDISTLIPLIKTIYKESSNHNFKLSIKDNAGKTAIKTLKFHLTGPSSISYNDDADLWKNTATLTAKVQATGDVKVEYRKKGGGDDAWQAAELKKNTDDTYTATIAPIWKDEGKHATGVNQYSLDGKTGVFAGNTYEYRLTIAGTEIDKKEFMTAEGQDITYGDMNTWSQYIGYSDNANSAAADYPNPDKDHGFWSNGNNNFTQNPTFSKNPLCSPGIYDENAPENKYAKLGGTMVLSSIFAAGNLFSGVFYMNPEGMGGWARFGQKYNFTARPIAMKVRIKATINNIETAGAVDELKPEGVSVGDPDPCRIFVCLTDWADRHSVYSGLDTTPELLNAFDPVTDATEPAEGNVLAYGSKMLTESVADWTELTIPILYKDKVAKPAADSYSLVISCASSAYGDYLWGNPENKFDVDDFEWVY